jgi:hypothetical protein
MPAANLDCHTRKVVFTCIVVRGVRAAHEPAGDLIGRAPVQTD